MLLGALGNAGRAATIIAKTSDYFSRNRVDALVVVDSPVLHIPIARRAKARGIPVLYYVAPQLWAWGRWRQYKIRACIDELAVILPFEEAFFRELGLPATFVGHPLADALIDQPPDKDRCRAIKSSGGPVVAVLPGSRAHVIRENLPTQLEVARCIRTRFPAAHIGVSIANEVAEREIVPILKRSALNPTIHRNENASLLSSADLTLVASGTATLEVAYYGSPMIVMYNGSRWMYHLLARWLLHIPRYSLVNIIADREIVPEFMPYYRSSAPIATCAMGLLNDDERRARMRQAIAQTIEPLRATGATRRTADLLFDLLARSAH